MPEHRSARTRPCVLEELAGQNRELGFTEHIVMLAGPEAGRIAPLTGEALPGLRKLDG